MPYEVTGLVGPEGPVSIVRIEIHEISFRFLDFHLFVWISKGIAEEFEVQPISTSTAYADADATLISDKMN